MEGTRSWGSKVDDLVYPVAEFGDSRVDARLESDATTYGPEREREEDRLAYRRKVCVF